MATNIGFTLGTPPPRHSGSDIARISGAFDGYEGTAKLATLARACTTTGIRFPTRTTTSNTHIIVTIDGKEEKDLDGRYEEIQRILAGNPGVNQLAGHRGTGGDNLPYQSAAALPPSKKTQAIQEEKSTSAIATGLAPRSSKAAVRIRILSSVEANRRGAAYACRVGPLRPVSSF